MRHTKNIKKYKILIASFVSLLSIFSIVSGALAQNNSTADLFLSTSVREIKEGQKVSIAVRINALSEPVNAVSGVLYFPAELVRVINLNKETGIVNLWMQAPKAISNRIIFEGVILNPGFQGRNGIIFYITFLAKKTGFVNLEWSEGSILANDGYGTNVATRLGGTGFRIIPTPKYTDVKPTEDKPTEIKPIEVKPVEITPIEVKPVEITPVEKKSVLSIFAEFPSIIEQMENLYLKAKRELSTFIEIIFRNISIKSLAEEFNSFLLNKKPALMLFLNILKPEILIPTALLTAFVYLISWYLGKKIFSKKEKIDLSSTGELKEKYPPMNPPSTP